MFTFTQEPWVLPPPLVWRNSYNTDHFSFLSRGHPPTPRPPRRCRRCCVSSSDWLKLAREQLAPARRGDRWSQRACRDRLRWASHLPLTRNRATDGRGITRWKRGSQYEGEFNFNLADPEVKTRAERQARKAGETGRVLKWMNVPMQEGQDWACAVRPRCRARGLVNPTAINDTYLP